MIGRLLDPAAIGLLVLLVSLLGWTFGKPRRNHLGRKTLAWTGFIILWLGSSPWISDRLARCIEPSPTDLGAALANTSPSDRAMVVLSGGQRRTNEPVPNVERLDATTQARLFGAARIYRENGPFDVVVVSGTSPEYVSAMADYLALLGVPIDHIVMEPLATNTTTNATFSAAILEKHAATKVVLVTSAIHIPRSVKAFRNAGVEVIPAPVDYIGGQSTRWLPASTSLARTSRVIHEILGRLRPTF